MNVWLGKLTALDMTPLCLLGRKTSTQTNKQTTQCLEKRLKQDPDTCIWPTIWDHCLDNLIKF